MWKQHFSSPCQKKGLWTRRWKRCDVHFVHGSPVNYDILYLSTKTENMYETAIPVWKMLNAFLAVHGRCKFIIFLRGQTPSLSAPTLILSLMEHFQGKAKNTVKHSVKTTFSIAIKKNFMDVKIKKMWCSFRPWFSSELSHVLLINRTTKNAWNRISNG